MLINPNSTIAFSLLNCQFHSRVPDARTHHLLISHHNASPTQNPEPLTRSIAGSMSPIPRSLNSAAALLRLRRLPPVRSLSGRGAAVADGRDSDNSSAPLADEIFRSAQSSGRYTQGDATYLALARAYADCDPPDLPALRRLLARMRRDQPRSFSDRVFIPILRALGRAGRPLSALRLFLRLLPSFRCTPSVRSLNSALAALLASPDPAHHRLAVPFISSALRRHSFLAPNLLTFNLLLKALCRSGDLDTAAHLLREDLPRRGLRPDAYSYSTLIAALAAAGRLPDAMALLDEMQVDGIAPTAPTFNSLITALCRTGDFVRAGNLTRYMLLKGCPPSLPTYNTLLHALCCHNRLTSAVRLLDRMTRDGLTPNQITYGSIIDGLVKIGRSEDAYQVFDQMEKKGVHPNEFVYSSLITGFFQAGNPDRALSIWEAMISKGVKPNSVLFTSLIDGLCCHGQMVSAEAAFSEMSATEDCTPNVVTFSSMIRGYFKFGDSQQALNTWAEMVRSGIEPNEVSYSILINGLCEAGRLRDALMVWKNMWSRGCAADVIAYSSIIKGLAQAGNVDGGMRLYNDMVASCNVEPDVVTYNILLDGLLKVGNVPGAMVLLGRMLDRGCDPDLITCNIFLKVFIEERGREFLDGLVVRLIRRGRIPGAIDIVVVMLGKYLAPELVTWEMVLTEVCKRRRVSKGIDKCWTEILR